MEKSDRDQDSLWVLRLDVASARVLLWLGSAGAADDLRPEVHLYLYDRYWRLGVCHQRAGRFKKATDLKARAEHHWRMSGGDEPPVAAATAMRPPRPSFRALAFRGRTSHSSGDDAA